MKKRYFICFAAIITVLAAAIIFILYKRENRELLLEDLWKNKEITEIAFVEETKGDFSGTVLSEEEMASFFKDFGSEKIQRIRKNDHITGWTHGVRMYNEKGEQVVFICFLGKWVSAGEDGTYLWASSEDEIYRKLALYEK